MTFHDPHFESDRPDIPPSVRAHAPWDPDDPRWSAYLLGEMSPAERLAVEAVLEDDPDARRDFEDLADAADLVRLAFETTAPVDSLSPHTQSPHTGEEDHTSQVAVDPVETFARPPSSPVLLLSAPSRRRLRSGGPIAFLAVAASLGLCLMLVGQNPARRDRGEARVVPLTTAVVIADNARDAPLLKGAERTTTGLASATDRATGAIPTHSFRLTPSLALSYYADSVTPVDALAVSVRNGGVPDRDWDDEAVTNRSRSPGDSAEPAAHGLASKAPSSQATLQQERRSGPGERGRESRASSDALGLAVTDSPRQQLSRPADSRQAAATESELREVRLVSRFQTPATVPVAAIPIQVGRQTMADVEQSLARGEWPAPESIRLEEMVNAFDYDDPLPSGDSIAELRVESGACPWNERHRLVRIGLRAQPVDLTQRPTFRAVFVVDSRRPEMLAQFNESLAETSWHFSPLDRVTVFDASGMISVPTVAGDQLEDQLRSLPGVPGQTWNKPVAVDESATPLASPTPTAPAGGASLFVISGKNRSVPPPDNAMLHEARVEAKGGPQQQVALDNAFEVARRTFVPGANNSVVLLTDEPLKGSEANETKLMEKVQSVAEYGVNLNTIDLNANYGNPFLYQLAELGNGSVNTVSTPDQLSDAVVQELAGGKSVVATEVELQVEFNPVRVEAYRLLGYEHWIRESLDSRLLSAQKELRAGDRLCAVIEVRLNPETSSTLASLPLRYRQSSDFLVDGDVRDGEAPAPPVDHEKEWLTARLIYTPPGSSLQATREVPFDGDAGSSSPALDWAACVVDFGERLKQPERLTTASLQGVRRRAQQAAGPDPLGTRQKFLNVLDQAIELTARTPRQPTGPATLSSGEARAKATCGGRYSDLLDKISAPGDHARYGAFHDLGFRPVRNDPTHGDLPAGHWVYVYPHWYIWGVSDEQLFMAAPPPPGRAAPAPAPP